MDNKNKEALRCCRVQLSEDLTVVELWDPLVQVGLFTPNELKQIVQPNSGSENPITRLLDSLEQKGPTALMDFKTALKDVNKPHLLDLLKENDDGKGIMVKVDKSDLNLLVKIKQNIMGKKQEIKDLVNDACQPQDDGSFNITREKRDLLLEMLENFNKFSEDSEDDTLCCGACICTDENLLCSKSNRLEAENKELQRQLDKVKTGSLLKKTQIKQILLDLLQSSADEDDEDENIKSCDLKMGINKLVLDIENDKESFA